MSKESTKDKESSEIKKSTKSKASSKSSKPTQSKKSSKPTQSKKSSKSKSEKPTRDKVTIKVKKMYPDSKLPYRKYNEDAGIDLFIHSMRWDKESHVIDCGLGVAFELPKGYVGLIFPRSSIYAFALILTNCVGVLDSNYRGEVRAKFRISFASILMYLLFLLGRNKFLNRSNIYHPGDRCCQMIVMPYPEVTIKVTNKLSESDRGTDGHGKSGIGKASKPNSLKITGEHK